MVPHDTLLFEQENVLTRNKVVLGNFPLKGDGLSSEIYHSYSETNILGNSILLQNLDFSLRNMIHDDDYLNNFLIN